MSELGNQLRQLADDLETWQALGDSEDMVTQVGVAVAALGADILAEGKPINVIRLLSNGSMYVLTEYHHYYDELARLKRGPLRRLLDRLRA